MKIELTKEQAEAILAYLMERPAKEVLNAIDWLRLAIEDATEL